MLTFLKDHPFAVESFFETSLVLTYAVPKNELLPFLPPCFIPDTFNNTWGFIAIACVKANALRPKGFPEWVGTNFILTGYRIFVRYTTPEGKRLRGLYILRSETNKSAMSILGNIFTHYNYVKTDIQLIQKSDSLLINATGGGLNIQVSNPDEASALPDESPFENWTEARRFAGPLPFTFSYSPRSQKVLIVEGSRQNWTPLPAGVLHCHSSYIESLGFKNKILANAFVVNNVSYFWKKGRNEIWTPV